MLQFINVSLMQVSNITRRMKRHKYNSILELELYKKEDHTQLENYRSISLEKYMNLDIIHLFC